MLIHKGEKLSVADAAENKRSILDGWRLHFANVTRSMQNGFYQSWDLHPNQLPARYAAVYAFFLEAADLQPQRLKAFIEKATQANLTGNIFDDAATAQGLVNFFRQAVGCGAMTEIEAEEETGLLASELQDRLVSADDRHRVEIISVRRRRCRTLSARAFLLYFDVRLAKFWTAVCGADAECVKGSNCIGRPSILRRSLIIFVTRSCSNSEMSTNFAPMPVLSNR